MSQEDIEEFDSINEPDDTVEVEDTEESSTEEEQPDVTKLQETNKKLFNRAKQAEAEAKEAKTKLAELLNAPASNQTNTADSLSREEVFLIAQGMLPEDLDKLKTVAKAEDVPLLEAKETELWQGYIEKKEAERKKEKAKIGSSKGSATTTPKKVSDLSEDEHRALVKETMANVR